jgi:hypothetical protein
VTSARIPCVRVLALSSGRLAGLRSRPTIALADFGTPFGSSVAPCCSQNIASAVLSVIVSCARHIRLPSLRQLESAMAHKHEHMPTSNEDTRTYRPLSVEERDRLAQQVGSATSQ